MTRSRWPHRPLPPWCWCLVLACSALAHLWLQRAPTAAPVVSQAFFGFIIAAISLVASWFGAAGGAIATASLAVINWLTSSVGWLTRRFLNIVESSGAMFSKLWDASKRFWFDVVRPALQRLAKWVEEARDWLKQKFGPVFRLLSKLRERIRDIYSRFIKPVLDAIEMARGVLQILEKLHVPFARALDKYLGEVENGITENYLWLLSQLNRVIDTVNTVVTLDFLFQRWSFLRTVERDAKFLWQALINTRAGVLTGADRASIAAKHVAPTPAQMRADFERFLETKDGPLAEILAESKAEELVFSAPAQR